MKANINEEVENATNSLNKLNSKIENIISFKLPKEESIRNIIKIKKIKQTDKKYPRNFGKISKNPL